MQDVGQGFSLANKEIKYKKRTRLKNFDYKGCYRYFITMCTFDKKNIFYSDLLISWMIGVLKKISDRTSFKVWVYCFMPDHLHLLIEGVDDNSDMKQFVSLFKQHTGFYYQKKFGEKLWQTNYYEHVLRNEEATLNVAYYIFENPVRKGLVEKYKQYNFLGSFEFDVKQT